VQGRDLSREVETCRATQRLVAQGEDLPRETETCRARQILVVQGGYLSWGSL
jgi:hypothetical protein